jgi:mRNA interferase RelE/StbE
MKSVYAKSFIKDLKKLRSTPVFERIKELAFETIPNASTLDKVPNVKQLKQAHYAYRIRIGDYRLGFTVDGETVVFKRVLHRKEIYRYFL